MVTSSPDEKTTLKSIKKTFVGKPVALSEKLQWHTKLKKFTFDGIVVVAQNWCVSSEIYLCS